MVDNIAIASEKLFGPTGIGATNVKLTIGYGQNITPDQLAKEVHKAITDIEAGNFEMVDTSDLD